MLLIPGDSYKLSSVCVVLVIGLSALRFSDRGSGVGGACGSTVLVLVLAALALYCFFFFAGHFPI